jgi:signal transduction histidine kinase
VALKDEARDPWTYVLGGLAGGVAWAVGVPAAIAVGVGAAVLGIKAVAGAMLGVQSGEGKGTLLPVSGKTPEDRWLKRGQRAVDSFAKLASSVPPGIVATKARTIEDQARQTLEGLRRLAGQASTTRSVSQNLDPATLSPAFARLTAQIARESNADIKSELQSSLESVEEQLRIAQRLSDSLAQLLARMESGALGLERLVAQLAELLALSETATSPVEGAKQLEALADDLEGIRSGLAETEQLSRRALAGFEGDGVASDGTD